MRERENTRDAVKKKKKSRREGGAAEGEGGGDCLAKEPLTTYDHVIN